MQELHRQGADGQCGGTFGLGSRGRPRAAGRVAVHLLIGAVLAGWAIAAPRAHAGSETDKPVDRFEATRARPLFSPTRRPRPPASPVEPQMAPVMPPPPPTPPPDLALSGIVIGSETRVALVRHPQDAVPTRIVVGSRIDGWTVADIQPRTVVLRLADRSVTVAFPDPGKPQPLLPFAPPASN